MKVHNVRLGFATNSSSTHSIILLPVGATQPNESDACGEFGWDYFVLTRRRTKVEYLAACVYQHLSVHLSNRVAEHICRSMFEGMFDPLGYVDHQSELAIPLSWDGKPFDTDYVDALRRFLSDDRIVIVGGNDNDDYVHPLVTSNVCVHVPLAEDFASRDTNVVVARYDARGNFWTLFSRSNGTKLRVSFDHDNPKCNPDKSEVPELVDLKITDRCLIGCDFCYQDSHSGGKHADIETIKDVLDALSTMKVFEVAIGGGEPTLHPRFEEILEWCRSFGIVPNFSTRNADITGEEPWWDIVGSVGFSVTYEPELYPALFARSDKTAVHVIADAPWVTEQQLRHVADFCSRNDIRLVLLGLKQTGRARHLKPNGHVWTSVFLNNMQDIAFPLDIDACLAERYRESLEASGVPKLLVTPGEGKFSMYIDAVNGRMGPSSYCPDDQLVPMVGIGHPDKLSESIVNAFRLM